MCLCCHHNIKPCYNKSCSYCITINDYTGQKFWWVIEFNNQNCPICCTCTEEQYKVYYDSKETCISSLGVMLSAPTNKTTGILVNHNPSEKCVECIFCGGVVAVLAFTECMFTWILYHFCMPFIGAYNHCENHFKDSWSSCEASCFSCFKNLSSICQEEPKPSCNNVVICLQPTQLQQLQQPTQL